MPPRRNGPRIDVLIIDNNADGIVEIDGGTDMNRNAVPDRTGQKLVCIGHFNDHMLLALTNGYSVRLVQKNDAGQRIFSRNGLMP
jgi:hypothetical protein